MAAGIGQQALDSLSGNVETALIVIHDYRESAAKSMQYDRNLRRKTSQQKQLAKQSALRAINTENALKGERVSYSGSQDRTLKVQFNPSALTLNASVAPKSKKDATSGASRTMAVEDARLNLTVQLYFDDMDTYDAFMWDKFTLGLSAQTAANAVKLGKDVFTDQKTVHSVQSRVEAFIAALRNPYTRTISFRWADFVFIGTLNTVKAQYTMFSPSGRPIRAKVLLRIQHEMRPAMLRAWYDSFENAFGGDTANLVKVEQSMSNLLNLPL